MVTKNIGVFLLLAASLAAGATYLLTGPDPVREPGSPDSVVAPSSFDAAAPIEDRIAALEQALGVERQARQVLQEELFVLTAEMERMSGGDARIGDVIEEPSTASATAQSGSGRQSRRRNNPEQRMERMIDAGFTPSEAEWIMRRESELQMEALQARYDARRAGESVSFFNRGSGANTIRDELGDDGYERYLAANGRSTSIAVSSVLEGSPALTAGLQPGDQIVSYDGRRVFSMDEITTLTMTGEAGQNVLVDISRNGVPMQVSIPRGPLGITGGRRFR